MPKLSLPDGAELVVDAGTPLGEVAARISRRLAKRAVAARLDDRLVDLSLPVCGDAAVRFLTCDDPEGLEVFRHSSAHLLAEAVVELFPDALPTIGPAVEAGFYYDFAHAPFSEEDLERIEQKMRELVSRPRPLQRREISRDEARALFRHNRFKLEMIEEMPADEPITVYQQGDGFVDLCRGPHLPDLSRIRACKLLKVAGAYWRGDARNVMLQRIYGISFEDPQALKKHLAMLEEAKKRDHRRIGQALDLFSFHDEGRGVPFWHDRGTLIFNTLADFMRAECRRRGYTEVRTPMILNEDLWRRSGHWDHYVDDMYFVDIDERPHAVKPMNCPGGLLIYKSRLRSYRDLPIRQAELGFVHRNELSGTLHGLFRVRGFTQDDAHIFCTREQLVDEVVALIEFTIDVYRAFGFERPEIKLSTQPEDYLGSPEIWQAATAALHAGLRRMALDYQVAEGEGAFYGPKIDFDIRDSLGRRWQCGTVQVDFSMPERFDLTYEGSDGQSHRPVLLHRAILGSLERFIGIVIEDTAGALPLWISPVQARIIPITEAHQAYASRVQEQLRDAGLHVELDARNESLGKRVREAQLEKANYILVVGQQEIEGGTVNVRTRDNVVRGPMPVGELLEMLQEKIRTRARE
ncbi:MAG: threonine--tRNA ligase [Candidatus Eisenbacteria bacterium]|nr:threonine--tRNA ligase [Candidatus Eisenbacteria bacterium]